MPEHYFGYPRSGGADDEASLTDFSSFEAALRGAPNGAAGEGPALGQADQVTRHLAEIERAAVALRRAQPALKTWNESSSDGPRDGAALASPKPRPIWLLIGLLWLWTALVTIGAVGAIRVLTG